MVPKTIWRFCFYICLGIFIVDVSILQSKFSDWMKKEWHITTDGRTENGVFGKKLRKYCGSMALMKLPLNKSPQMTGQTSVPTDGVTIGQLYEVHDAFKKCAPCYTTA